MARTKTTKSSETESVPTPAVVAPVIVSVAPAAEKVVKAKKPKAVKSEESVSKTVTASSDVQSAVVDVAAVVETETPICEQSMEFLARLQQIGGLISSIKSDYRNLEKKWSRELKAAQKLNSKRKRKSGNRAPSGFVKPTRISDELAKFLEKPSGSEMARTEVTRDINKYIRTNNLQDVANGRKINPDAKLATLLKLKKTDELTYFNLQRYMSPHFAKAVKADATVAVAPTTV
jgi:upstream activation factor subunit UAF30